MAKSHNKPAGFKNCGGAKSGFSFPKSAGFSDSTGRVKSVSGYTRTVPTTVRSNTPRGGK
jgi:hypothetical protein